MSVMDKRNLILSIAIVFSTIVYAFADFGHGSTHLDNPYSTEYVLSNPTDTIPLQERYDNFIDNQNRNPFDLKDPPIIEKEVEYDPETGQYIVYERIGEEYYRAPTYMTFDEYLEYQEEKQEREYFQKLSGLVDANASIDGGLIDPIKKLNLDENLLDRLFGGTAIDIKPTGKVGLVFGVRYFKTENPAQIQQRQGQIAPLFNMSPLEMNVQGKIGDKLNLDMGYNPNATFDFDNQMKINYSSDDFSEDEIIKKIEAGNVTLPLRSNLIQGSESLFGIKTELQFGRFWLTALVSSKNSQQEEITIQNGAQEQFFEVQADQYDEFRHFFLSHYNRDQFESSMTNLPQINTLFRINKMDVWITNDNNNVNDASREIVAFADIGEAEAENITNDVPGYGAVGVPRNRDLCGDNELPSNDSNDLYARLKDNEGAKSLDRAVSTLQALGFQQGQDYEKVRARRLNQSEYTFHPQLGFISVNINLRPDQVLAVSYEYTYNGQTYIVGDFASDVPNSNGLDASFNDPNQPQQQDTLEQQNVLFTKLLKGTTPRIDLPLWDLMMKNVYSVGAFQVDREEFKLDIFYDDPGQAEKRFLPSEPTSDNPIFDGEPLLRVFNLDNLNVQGDPSPDGIFDFVEGVTINTRNGRIMFPVLEPFGSHLADQIDDPSLSEKYNYFHLYDSTVTRAREYPELNRFRIRGKYQSSVSSEISLGAFNLPEGSVRVFAGGVELSPERGDVEIDYNIGRVRILNEAYLNSGSPITVRFENTALFGFQQKTMIGLRGEYRFNEDVSLGGTYMHLFERPFTQKVNIGDDPINNRIYGLDFSMTKEAPWMTKALDALPFLQTKAPSTFNLLAEGAYLRPGHARAINETGDDGDKEGILMLDDFEGSTNSIILGIQPNQWFLASTPQNDADNNNPLFPEGSLINDPANGVNRAKLSWYDLRLIQTPTVDDDVLDASYFSNISQLEVFPNRQLDPLSLNNYTTFDLTYYPKERGPYNYDLPEGGTPFSAGLDQDGGLEAPETRWAGIMREITANNDFEQSNVEFIEFWMLSPFLPKRNDPNISGAGDLYINLGNVSEDVIRDSRQAFENGLPGVVNNVDRPTRETALGRVPEVTPVVNGFNLELEDREAQDVGLDGLDDSGELNKFSDIMDIYENSTALTANAKQRLRNDLSADNFVSFNDETVTETGNPLDRFRNFNGTENNSPQNASFGTGGGTNSIRQATNLPDAEDLNNDKSLNETEAYFQYKIPLIPDGTGGVELNEFITDVRRPDGANGRIWYRFRIPLDQYTSAVGGIQDFRSIRFFRMYMTGFDETVTFRFANLELVRSQWRRYLRGLENPFIGSVDPDGNTTLFDVNALNIEENGGRCPFNYVLPPGIQREQSLGAFPNILQNEQSLSLSVCNLQDGDARAIYKLLDFDMRVYKRLKMFLHAEVTNEDELDTGDMTAFMRIGSDFENNYYEYEIPLDFSDPTTVMDCETAQGNNAIDPDYVDEVWKENNEFDFPFDLLKNVKVARNESGASITQPFEMIDPEKPQNRVRVVGSPTMGRARGVMIGLRNTVDDGVPTCAEIWVNELRVSGFDERDGMAGLIRMDMQLADLGQLAFSGQATSIGWGGIEDRVQERARERVTEYEATASLELGKFLPEKSGIKIPFLASVSNNTSTPEFDPYDTDLKLKDKIDRAATIQEKDSIRAQAKDVTNIRSYNFTNVRKERTKEGTPMPWDISNFSFTYARSVTEHSDPIVENERIDQYQGAIDYNFNIKPLYIQPFKKLIKKDKYLKLISEMNFNLLPNKFSFNTIMDRNKTETSYRFVDGPEYTKTFFNKRFTWDRNYNLDWDFTKSLKIRFDARNQAVIDELQNYTFDNPEILPVSDAELKDFIWEGIRNFGRTKNYDHSLNVSYNVPLKKIPFLDWITVKANYTADYSWSASALNTIEFGNVISNAQDRKLNADFNFESLYKKSKYLDKINRGNRKSRGRGSSRLSRGLNKNSVAEDKKDKKKKRSREPSKAEKVLIRPLMTIRKAKLSYQETFGTVLPGFMPETELFGLSKGFDAPGWDFVAGYQPNTAWFDQAFENGWMTESTFLTEDINQQYNQNINASLSLEPINDLRVELTATRQFTENFTETFKDTDKSDGVVRYEHLLPRYVGSMNVSYSALNTLFRSGNDEILGLFTQFEDNREIISTNINGASGSHSEDAIFGDYTDGYGRKQLNVLIPAFLAAYTDKDPMDLANTLYPVNETNTSNIELFNLMPKINWNLSYNGLSKLPKMKDIFKSFDISHSYKSNMIINSFNTDLDYEFGKRNPDTDNFFSTFEIPQLSIAEAFSPLIGIGFELQNSMSFDFSYNKSRVLDMRFNDLTLTESRSDEITVGFGYTKENVYIGFLKNLGQTGGSKKKKKKKRKGGLDKDKDTDPEEEFSSDLTFQFDLSFRDDASYQHRLDQDSTEPTRGTRDFRITPSIDYDINEQLNVQMYFEYTRTVPKVTTSFPSTRAEGGIRLLFTL